MKAAIYVRQSKDDRGDELGISRQRQQCVALCEAKGWPWAEYADNDTSATKSKPRRAYQQMIADIESGAINAVVVYHLDRLHRQPIELEQFMLVADDHGVKLASVTGDVNLGNDNGRLIARITGAVARAEIERKSQRMRDRYAQDRQLGKPYGPARAFGYTRDHQLDPVTAPAVRAAYEAVLAGRSMYGIAKDWNAAGFTSARGKAWTQTSVRAVLLNPKNAALMSLGREVIDGEANWPAIVDRDVFESVRAMLTDPSRVIGPGPGRKYLLSGLALCGKCGNTLGSAMPSKRGQMPRYHCKHCHGVARKIETVDGFVLDVVAERLSRPDAVDLLARKDRPDLKALRSKATALRAKQVELADMWATDEMTRAQFTRASSKIDTQLAEIDAATLDANRSRVLDGVIVPGDRAAVRAHLDALPLDRQRAIIDLLLTVTVLPGQARGPLRTDLLPIDWKVS